MPYAPAYTPAERAALRTHYATATRAELLDALPGRSWNAMQLQARSMNLSRPIGNWTEAQQLILIAEYPLRGAKYVSALVDHDEEMVRRRAHNLKIARLPATAEQQAQRADAKRAARRLRYRKGLAERPKQTVRVPVKAAPLPRPSAVAVPLLAVKQSIHTPNLNVAREARKRKEANAKSAAPITADAIRQLPANHPARHAYAMDGVRGWQQWKAAQA